MIASACRRAVTSELFLLDFAMADLRRYDGLALAAHHFKGVHRLSPKRKFKSVFLDTGSKGLL
jgi:hypothetical protein